MHRRQYIPHSHNKLSRRQLRAEREQLLAEREAARADARAEAKARADAQNETLSAHLRRFAQKTKRFFTQPIRLRPQRTA